MSPDTSGSRSCAHAAGLLFFTGYRLAWVLWLSTLMRPTVTAAQVRRRFRPELRPGPAGALGAGVGGGRARPACRQCRLRSWPPEAAAPFHLSAGEAVISSCKYCRESCRAWSLAYASSSAQGLGNIETNVPHYAIEYWNGYDSILHVILGNIDKMQWILTNIELNTSQYACNIE